MHGLDSMNIFSRLLLHLRRASLRKQFMKQQTTLREQFQTILLNSQTERQWLDIEWITEPVLFVTPDILHMPVALVGVAAIYRRNESGIEKPPETQAGTALFYFQETQWQTNGTLLPNLTPSEALNQLELKTISLPV